MRVLHAPVNVGNQPWTLSRAERALGLKSDLVVNYSTWLNYPADRVLGTGRGALLRRRLWGYGAPFFYDVLHCYFGRSLLYWDDLPEQNRAPWADMKLARRLGKRVFMTLQGCDARIASRSHARNAVTPCAEGRCSAYATCLAQLDAQRLNMIENVLPLCDRVFYLNPELGWEVPRGEFMPYANVDISAFEPAYPSLGGVPKIVHAPSDRAMKGTDAILQALDALSSRYKFELTLVTGLTHAEAMALYRTADIAIDQILAGWYGGFAVEMMAMGKPVLCGLRESDFRFAHAKLIADLPIVPLRPDRLEADLAAALDARAQWPAWGAAARRFVERWHDPARIARWMREVYRAPTTTLAFDPDEYGAPPPLTEAAPAILHDGAPV